MTDYTNDRWHVNRTTVTHDDFPGMSWNFCSETEARGLSRGSGESTSARSHFARAWLAAQPKPTIKVGMRIEATLRNGTVVTGGVTGISAYSDWTMVHIGPGIACYADVDPKYEGYGDITDWHEVTS